MLSLITVLTCTGAVLFGVDVTSIRQLSLAHLEERLVEIEQGLESLAYFSLNSGVGPIGYRSMAYDAPDHFEWVQINLEQTRRIDQIVLVPTVWRDMAKGFVADGFPVAFHLRVGRNDDSYGRVVADYDFGDVPLESVAPLVIPIESVEADWIRLEATRLSKRARDHKYIFQLAEIMAFEGPYNQALHQPVAISRKIYPSNAWGAACLVDGILPYAMNAAYGEKSLPMISRVNVGETATISIDLEANYPLSRLRLHAVDQGDTMPRAFQGDFGIPQAFILEGANQPDFSDAVRLLEVRFNDIFEMGPIMEWAFPEHDCQYVRLVATKPYMYRSERVSGTRIGFAELELLAEGANVALDKMVTPDFRLSSDLVTRGALTDGHNLSGQILPIREWMEQLAKRSALEAERPLVLAQISEYYAVQKKRFRLLAWLIAFLLVLVVLATFYARMARQRREASIRERIAANLHDELGANLHAIGLFGDLAKDAVDRKEELVDTLDRMRALTVRTGKAARNCANLLEAQGFCDDLLFEMKQDMDHLLADLEHQFVVEGENFLQQIQRRTRLDLYLFYKEALTNIIRHSGATEVSTTLIADAKVIRLMVIDNGHGILDAVPKALARRARLLRADLNIDTPEDGSGTRVYLVVKKRRFGVL
ncbi:histidine kinase [Coraliomargarita sp. SDUM461003]|uniref:histidine kinase n=1 Tax=Thalassobacterium maritimum TaxID=3041265 RepID=A0ABU1AT76_9BACT|nr:histidine kinase [Coraliomargarita sp. SDUM461003]MDQ8207360.1 histidine kinase [Coraliomargarita sp. SDUM461003]